MYGKSVPVDFKKIPSMLCLDAFRGHLTDAVREKIHSLASDLAVIPAGMTAVLQPLDVSINKTLKGYVQEQYEKWFCEPNHELIPTGKIRKRIEGPMIVKSFKNCCISSALDGSKDDVLWNDAEDGGERGNESTSTSSGHNSDDSEYHE